MSEESQSNLNEMMAGDGSGLALPPAFVFVNTSKKRVLKKKKQDEKIDGRKKSARKLVNRILTNRSKRKGKMSEEITSVNLSEAEQSATEKAQKQIKQQKTLKSRQELQKKRQDAKAKMQDKAQEMDTLVKARLTDFRKKAAEKQQKAQKVVQKNSFEPTGEVISEMDNVGAAPTYPWPSTSDVFAQAYKISQEGNAYGRDPEISFAQVRFQDGTGAQMSFFDAQKIVAAYEGLNDENRTKFCALLNMNATTYANALQFAQYNV
jgi:hypothetical protein